MSKPANPIVFRRQIDFDQKDFIGDRELQEDYSSISFLKNQTELLFVLADGMGGHAGGEVASKKSVDTFVRTFIDYPSESLPAKLGAALQQANNELANEVNANPALDGMGCTLVGLHISGQGINWISVGDSPLFLVRKNQLIRLNEDHSMAPLIEKSLRDGKITIDEANQHPQRHSLRSALMGSELALIDTPSTTFPLQAGDVVILASDGILSLADDEILKTVKSSLKSSAENMTSALLMAVRNKRRPRQDNTTVQVFIAPTDWAAGSSKSLLWLLLSMCFFAVAAMTYLYFSNVDNKKVQAPTKIVEPVSTDEPVPVPIPEPPQKGVDTPKPENNSINGKDSNGSKDGNGVKDGNGGKDGNGKVTPRSKRPEQGKTPGLAPNEKVITDTGRGGTVPPKEPVVPENGVPNAEKGTTGLKPAIETPPPSTPRGSDPIITTPSTPTGQ